MWCALSRVPAASAEVPDGGDALRGIPARQAPSCMRVCRIAHEIDLLQACEHGRVHSARRQAGTDSLSSVESGERLALPKQRSHALDKEVGLHCLNIASTEMAEQVTAEAVAASAYTAEYWHDRLHERTLLRSHLVADQLGHC